jgi:RNA polymerase sigma factor (sigma-70 family)
MNDSPFQGTAPHCDPLQWDRLIESVGGDALLVVIEREMGRAVGLHSTAEDVWQETLALAWRDREQHSWESVRAYRAWLLAIARNQVAALARRMAADKRGGGEATGLFSDLTGGGAQPLSALQPAGSTTPSALAGARERSHILGEALASLPEDFEPVVRLYLFEERPMQQIADELGLGLAAAWYRFRKGSELYAQALEVLRTRATRAGSVR